MFVLRVTAALDVPIFNGAADTVADGGGPPGLSESYYKLRAIDCVLPADAVWQEALADQMYPA